VARFILIFALVVLWLYTLIDCIRTPRSEVRLLPKGMWILLMILPTSVLASGLYWLVGRPLKQQGDGRGGLGARRGPKAPDDDPEFLRKVDEKAWRERMERRRRQGKDDRNPGAGSEGEPRPA
jgi:hypothetical protein